MIKGVEYEEYYMSDNLFYTYYSVAFDIFNQRLRYYHLAMVDTFLRNIHCLYTWYVKDGGF